MIYSYLELVYFYSYWFIAPSYACDFLNDTDNSKQSTNKKIRFLEENWDQFHIVLIQNKLTMNI